MLFEEIIIDGTGSKKKVYIYTQMQKGGGEIYTHVIPVYAHPNIFMEEGETFIVLKD